jgi:hypothetical protein
MAMTKKEQAYVEALLTVSALRYTADVAPDVPVPEGGSGKTTRGFLYYGECSGSPRLQEIESTSYSHRDVGSSSGSQGCRVLYSTKLLALKALRRAVEKECARRLRQVDCMIERETNEKDMGGS